MNKETSSEISTNNSGFGGALIIFLAVLLFWNFKDENNVEYKYDIYDVVIQNLIIRK